MTELETARSRLVITHCSAEETSSASPIRVQRGQTAASLIVDSCNHAASLGPETTVTQAQSTSSSPMPAAVHTFTTESPRHCPMSSSAASGLSSKAELHMPTTAASAKEAAAAPHFVAHELCSPPTAVPSVMSDEPQITHHSDAQTHYSIIHTTHTEDICRSPHKRT